MSRQRARVRNTEPEVKPSRLDITDEEIELLQFYADGKTTDEIAAHYGVNKQTINNRKRTIFIKMDVAGIIPAISKAFRDGIVE